MPVNVSSSEALADIDISNSSRLSGSRQDASRNVEQFAAPAGAAFTKSRNASSQMAASGKRVHLDDEGDRSQRSTEQAGSLNPGRRQDSDGLLQIPPETVNARPPPAATAVWDWDTDLGLIGDSSNNNNYYYEPQGELLQAEQRQHKQAQDEFNIPHAVAGSGLLWKLQAPEEDEQGFVVPQRPSSTTQALAGNKRKSTSEASWGKQPDPKRSSRIMSETTEGESPPAESTSTSSSVRPQPGPAGRLRSQTDTASETRSRSEVPGLGGTRPGHGPAGLRRTLTDPSIPMVLPARKVFPIQIGDKLFRLSGASISSDGEFIIPFPCI